MPTRVLSYQNAADRQLLRNLAAARRAERIASLGSDRSDESIEVDWRDGKIVIVLRTDDVTGAPRAAGLFHRLDTAHYLAINAYYASGLNAPAVMTEMRRLVRDMANRVPSNVRVDVVYLAGSIWDTYFSRPERAHFMRREPIVIGTKNFVLFWTTAGEVLANIPG